MLECDIPDGWLAYFEPTGRSVPSPDSAAEMLDAQSGERKSGGGNKRSADPGMWSGKRPMDWECEPTTGGASRFFFVAKASRRERNAGLAGMPEIARNGTDYRRNVNTSKQSDNGIRGDIPRANHHPTVKPIALMRWLVRLVTPPGGVVLDPFMGSGSTGCACALEGFDFLGIEQDAEYAAIAERRIAFWRANGDRPVKASNVPVSSTDGTYASGKGLAKLARCPDHDSPRAGVTAGPEHYRCGCRVRLASNAERQAQRRPRPTMLQPSLPLDGAAD